MTLLHELAPAYELFRKGPHGYYGQHEQIEILWLEIRSIATGYLLAQDRKIRENQVFGLPIFFPRLREPAQECLILGHGFNESDYIKLFPWAYCLCRNLQIPVLIFPCAFHMNRRPGSWAILGRGLYHRRKCIPGNRASSPFNAVVSQRLSEAPERFLRGALQSYQDLSKLVERIRRGSLEAMGPKGPLRPLAEDSVVHFLGYSMSGYLFLGALLMDEKDWPAQGRLVLFNSFSAWDQADPVSVLVVDQEAYERATCFYLEGYRKEASIAFRLMYEDTQEGVLFRRLFLKHSDGIALSREVSRLKARLLLISDPHDPVFPAGAIKEHLGNDISTLPINLGRHEFPFNIPRGEMSFLDLARAIRQSWTPASPYHEAFFCWVKKVAEFLQPSPQLRLK